MMRPISGATWAIALAMIGLCVRSAAFAQASADRPAAIVVYPYVTVDTAAGNDTRIQLTNVLNGLREVRCFYEDQTPECRDGAPGESCTPGAETCSGRCAPRDVRIPFRVRLTGLQPVSWLASLGSKDFPIDGVEVPGPGGMSNRFSEVPALGDGPLTGTLRCVVVGANPLEPDAANALVGLATIEHRDPVPLTTNPDRDAAMYRAVGMRSLPDIVLNDDEFLQLGGPSAEYEGCPAFTVLQHMLGGAPLQTGDTTASVETTLALTTCGASLASTSSATAMLLLQNEFGTRLSTSVAVLEQYARPLSLFDTTQPDRSIFSVGVNGTLTAETLITPTVGNGLLAVAIQTHRDRVDADRVHSDALNVHGMSERAVGDALAYRPPRCPGDCNLDGMVGIGEVVTGVNMALEVAPIERCPPFNQNADPRITIEELVGGVRSVLDGCAEPSDAPAVTVVPTVTPTRAPDSEGPLITYLGLATAADRPLRADETDTEGRPVFIVPVGQGVTIVVEARRANDGAPVETITYSPGTLPGLQLLVSRALGDGGAAECEGEGQTGGVPGTPSLEFSEDAATVAAINDLGCRAFDRQPRGDSICTRRDTMESPFSRVANGSEIQFCVPIARAWSFANDETIVAARVSDVDGNASEVREMVVRVEGP